MAMSIENVHEQVVDLLASLVAYPTESRTSNHDLIDLVVSLTESAGASTLRVEGEPGRANLLVRFGPAAPGGVLVSGHTDVVPAGTGWKSDPYVLEREGERLGGRGTADMKGFIACAIAVAMQQEVKSWTAPLYIGLSYDEEIGCAGVPSLLAELAKDSRIDPEIVVVGEPTMLSLRTSHAGKVAYSLHATGSSGHSSLAPTRTNAIDQMVSIAGAVAEVNVASRHLGVSTNVGTLSGGVAVNVLAPSCKMTFECRHPVAARPDDALHGVWSQIERSRKVLADVDGTVELTQDSQYPALQTDPNNAAVQRLSKVIGSEPAGNLDFGCEAGLYSNSLGVSSVVFGPGDIAVAHRPDEYVDRAQIDGACAAIQALANAYCAPEGIDQN